jgi:SAM-dependent methyltransferase
MDSKLPRYTLQIDEDGYPQFNGLRVDDEPLLKELLGKIRRWDPQDLRSTLVTQCDGELCFLDAFSMPLVAQSVEDISPSSSLWIFPGGRREKVSHDDLRQDGWGRLHTWIGADKIGATMRAKAQASLLNQLSPTLLSSLSVAPLWKAEAAVQGEEFWEQCYLEKKDGWEMGGPTPVLTLHFTEVKKKFSEGSEILVPGCGRGHDAAFLAGEKLRVTALDFSEEALKASRDKYGSVKGLSFEKADVFSYLKKNPQRFDGIFEHTLFCAIDPEERQKFIHATAQALRPSGYWFGVFFMRSSPGGPPFGLTQWELRERVQADFEIFDWKISPASATPRKNQELWAVFRRRPL